jgi:hypothetical protein
MWDYLNFSERIPCYLKTRFGPDMCSVPHDRSCWNPMKKAFSEFQKPFNKPKNDFPWRNLKTKISSQKSPSAPSRVFVLPEIARIRTTSLLVDVPKAKLICLAICGDPAPPRETRIVIELNAFVSDGVCAACSITVAPSLSNTEPYASDAYGAMGLLQPVFAPPVCAAANRAVMTMKRKLMRRLTHHD